jgi:hypothetical protein
MKDRKGEVILSGMKADEIFSDDGEFDVMLHSLNSKKGGEMKVDDKKKIISEMVAYASEGGPGSGHFNHNGVKGVRGGSLPDRSAVGGTGKISASGKTSKKTFTGSSTSEASRNKKSESENKKMQNNIISTTNKHAKSFIKNNDIFKGSDKELGKKMLKYSMDNGLTASERMNFMKSVRDYKKSVKK